MKFHSRENQEEGECSLLGLNQLHVSSAGWSPVPWWSPFLHKGLEDRGPGMARRVQNTQVFSCIRLYPSLKHFKDTFSPTTFKKVGSEEVP